MVVFRATRVGKESITRKCKTDTSYPVHTLHLDMTKETVVRNVWVVIYGAKGKLPSLAYDLKGNRLGLWLNCSRKAKPSLKTFRTKK